MVTAVYNAANALPSIQYNIIMNMATMVYSWTILNAAVWQIVNVSLLVLRLRKNVIPDDLEDQWTKTFQAIHQVPKAAAKKFTQSCHATKKSCEMFGWYIVNGQDHSIQKAVWPRRSFFVQCTNEIYSANCCWYWANTENFHLDGHSLTECPKHPPNAISKTQHIYSPV